MKNLIRLCIVSGLCLSALNMAGREITLTPGTLQYRLDEIRGNSDPTLVLKGRADVRDLALLKKMSAATEQLDLSGLRIEAYTYPEGGYMGIRAYKANELPGALLLGTSVKKITLPDGLTAIGESAFSGCELLQVTIPASVTATGDYLFSGLTSLKAVVLPASALKGKGMFRNCSALNTVSINGSPASIPESTFEGCSSLTQNPVPRATQYGAKAFMRSGITSIDLSSATEVGDYAFAEMPALKSVTIAADGSTTFGTGAFYGDPVLSDLPEWKANIPPLLGAKSNAKVSKKINSDVIEEGAFANNTATSTIMLGKMVREIRKDAFRNNTGIDTVYVSDLRNTTPTLDHDAFSGLENSEGRYDIVLYVADNSMDVWKAHPEWSRFDIRKVIESGIDEVTTSEIRAERRDNILHISAGAPIDYLDVSTLSGLSLYAGNPGASEISLTVPAGMIIIKIQSGNRLKVIKLL